MPKSSHKLQHYTYIQDRSIYFSRNSNAAKAFPKPIIWLPSRSANTIEQRIRSYANLPEGWNYGDGGPLPEVLIEIALVWNEFLRNYPFSRRDTCPGDNRITIGCGISFHYIEVISELKGDTVSYSLAYDIHKKQQFFKEGLSPADAAREVNAVLEGIWKSLTLSIHEPTIQKNENSFVRPLETTEALFPLSVSLALPDATPRYAHISESIFGTVVGQKLLPILPFFGSSTQTRLSPVGT